MFYYVSLVQDSDYLPIRNRYTLGCAKNTQLCDVTEGDPYLMINNVRVKQKHTVNSRFWKENALGEYKII